MIIHNTMREVVYGAMVRSRVDNNTLSQPGRPCESNVKHVHIKEALHMRYSVPGARNVPPLETKDFYHDAGPCLSIRRILELSSQFIFRSFNCSRARKILQRTSLYK
jgi:hypothetical protein